MGPADWTSGQRSPCQQGEYDHEPLQDFRSRRDRCRRSLLAATPQAEARPRHGGAGLAALAVGLIVGGRSLPRAGLAPPRTSARASGPADESTPLTDLSAAQSACVVNSVIKREGSRYSTTVPFRVSPPGVNPKATRSVCPRRSFCVVNEGRVCNALSRPSGYAGQLWRSCFERVAFFRRGVVASASILDPSEGAGLPIREHIPAGSGGDRLVFGPFGVCPMRATAR